MGTEETARQAQEAPAVERFNATLAGQAEDARRVDQAAERLGVEGRDYLPHGLSIQGASGNWYPFVGLLLAALDRIEEGRG